MKKFSQAIIIKKLGIRNWKYVYELMNKFTKERKKNTLDEIWMVEHYPVFTLGQTKNFNNSLSIDYINNIPVFPSNRGGKITYHGPGQQLIYFLINLRNQKINFKEFLFFIQEFIINILKKFFIDAYIDYIHPGIYYNLKKIASVGLRIEKGCSLHGFSLNVNMSLYPFKYIFPCGNKKIQMTQMIDINKNITFQQVQIEIIKQFHNMCNIYKVLSV
ncbi:lipoyl(octanoyl) transferase LipB [Buchnera aphidicola (Kurisakia onigurumii)]|uniref:lipoyl(octanoyl) transferase LipB n=1 Tax=Buchnera aphidicola TaxID=9 RepID=UPI0031B6E2B4